MNKTIKAVLTQEITNLIKLQNFPKINVVSFFCEEGNYIFYLRQQFRKNVNFFGITPNPESLVEAQERANLIRLTNCVFIVSTLAQLPKRINNTHLAYAIDAFKSKIDRVLFFQAINEKLVSTGRLIVIDTFLTDNFFTRKLSQQQIQYVENIRNGGVGANLMAALKLIQVAEKEGFTLIHSENLTSTITFNISKSTQLANLFLGKILRKKTSFNNKVSRNAWQKCLKQGLVEYRLLIFEKKEKEILLLPAS